MSGGDVVGRSDSMRHGVPHRRRVAVCDSARDMAVWTSRVLLAPRALGKEGTGSPQKTHDADVQIPKSRNMAPSRAVAGGRQ